MDALRSTTRVVTQAAVVTIRVTQHTATAMLARAVAMVFSCETGRQPTLAAHSHAAIPCEEAAAIGGRPSSAATGSQSGPARRSMPQPQAPMRR